MKPPAPEAIADQRDVRRVRLILGGGKDAAERGVLLPEVIGHKVVVVREALTTVPNS